MSRRRTRRAPRGAHVAPTTIAAAPARPARTHRIAAVDALRGCAIGLMIVYHFLFDLNWFGVLRADFNNDPGWLGFRDVIVSLFLLLVGVSLTLADRAAMSRRRFWRRIALVAACALLVTVGSYITFPKSFITFGILHCIVVASLLAWPVVRYPRVALMIGLVIIVAGIWVRVPLFDAPWLNWVGLMTHKPATEDYVPLLPWLGVVLVGIAAGAWLMSHGLRRIEPLSRAAPAWLTWTGRHSLLIYMVHQPVMLGMLRVAL